VGVGFACGRSISYRRNCIHISVVKKRKGSEHNASEKRLQQGPGFEVSPGEIRIHARAQNAFRYDDEGQGHEKDDGRQEAHDEGKVNDMSILKEFFKDVLKDGERIVKDGLGKDVPQSPLRGHEDVKAILQGITNLVEQGIEEGAVELHKKAVDAAWDVVKGISVGGVTITRETYDLIVRAVVDQIIEIGGEK